MSEELCRYCYTYHTAEKREYTKIEDRVETRRWCPFKMRYVKPDREACEDFTLSKFFYCDHDHCWLHYKVCLSRNFKGNSGECRLCVQGEQIIDIMRGRRE